jgi:hypothetical protein
MKRIGMAASKMAKDSLFLYNAYVILLAFLFSLFIFLIAGATVLIALFVFGYLATEFKIFDFAKSKDTIFVLCIISLTSITIIFNILAVIKNIQLPHRE